jgi:hypothetical protein
VHLGWLWYMMWRKGVLFVSMFLFAGDLGQPVPAVRHEALLWELKWFVDLCDI